jgi:signal transduction histidine kinase
LSTEEKNKVVIILKDTGVGISSDKLAMIFTPFYTDKIRGNGLGLAIAKNIIEEHDGSISVESEIGKGASFIITLAQQ